LRQIRPWAVFRRMTNKGATTGVEIAPNWDAAYAGLALRATLEGRVSRERVEREREKTYGRELGR
jgi:hypothetical protein